MTRVKLKEYNVPEQVLPGGEKVHSAKGSINTCLRITPTRITFVNCALTKKEGCPRGCRTLMVAGSKRGLWPPLKDLAEQVYKICILLQSSPELKMKGEGNSRASDRNKPTDPRAV